MMIFQSGNLPVVWYRGIPDHEELVVLLLLIADYSEQ